MSKRAKAKDALRNMDFDGTSIARQSSGRGRYGDGSPPPARRLSCPHCKRTARFSWARLHTVCANCGVGRWQ